MNILLLMASIVHCYVGCNSGSEDLQALHVLECDTETGAARIIQSVKGVEGTTYFQIDREGRYLYSMTGMISSAKSTSAIVRFPIGADGLLGPMEKVADLPCEAPCHLSLTPDGKRVAFAAYCSATAGTVGVDGKDLKTFVFPDDAMGPNKKRQQKAFAHQTFYLQEGQGLRSRSTKDVDNSTVQPSTSNLQPSLGVVDLGCDRIWFFNPVTMVPDLSMDIRFDSGDGPRHAVLSKDGRFLFVLAELGSNVSSFAFNGHSFTRIGKWTMLPSDFNRWEKDGETLATKAAAIKLTADGKILMASNRGHDSIAFYDVKNDGTLKLRNIAKLTGRFPRDFELMPGERFMVVGHKMSNEVQVYRFDRAACTLTPVGDPIPAWRPLCFKFAP